MKNWSIIVFTFLAFSSWGQNHNPKELGIGFAIATNPYQFENSTHPTNIFTDQELKTKRTVGNIFPFFYKPDYGLYHFICLKKTKDFYKILINDSESAFIPNDSNFYFQTWDAILLNSSVERILKTDPIRKNHSSESGSIQYDCEFDRFFVTDIIEIRGEYWLAVEFAPKCEEYPTKETKMNYGWIRWRTDKKLLIRIMLLC